MADFKQAVKWCLESKKTHTGQVWYMVIIDNNIIFRFKDTNSDSNVLQQIKNEDIDALNWKIYKEEDEGTEMLRLFRSEQLKKGHQGCDCTQCAEDMGNALKTFKRNR